jgi:hypothetical protein
MDYLNQFDSLAPFGNFEEHLRNNPLQPEKVLMVAVLRDAIDCYQRYATARERRRQRAFAEAENWFMEEDGDWLFSFANICTVLGLSPGFIRAGLLRWKERQTATNLRCKIYRFKARRGKSKRETMTA